MYEAKHVLKSVKFESSPDSIWGDHAHHHLEMAVASNGQVRIPPELNKRTGQNMTDYQWVSDALLQRAANKGGTILPERKFAIGKQKESASYWDKFGFLRGKIDVTIIYPHLRLAEVFDHKSGKKKEDPAQLTMYNASALVDYPEIDVVKGAYIWLQLPPKEAIGKPITHTRDQLPAIWNEIDRKYHAVVRAWETNTFPPRPSGLCGWCDVKTCEFWFESKEKLRRKKLAEA